ncbi:hypothetical protein DOTSEDRAFT_27569 [Dothistroma septosporum NZE10]|uniref:Uncharacterized protein n=1 Tax=Dothistroma septosporum (strain NZE10 / CBS 128990) TaxID=675120 RepID=N1PFU1_DOTSN|nr:hypothetical protein DOTSEDRAFT_27569 [Dothistroma septosporum NZE10]
MPSLAHELRVLEAVGCWGQFAARIVAAEGGADLVAEAGGQREPEKEKYQEDDEEKQDWNEGIHARLEQLVDGGELVEATEETRDAISAQIAVMLASREEEICNDEKRVQYLADEQQQADAELQQQWMTLREHAEEIIDAVKLDEARSVPSILPGHFRDQLDNYENARSALQKRKRATLDLEGEMDSVNAKLSMAEGKHNFAGWLTTSGCS